jgi:hypothetical protein
MALKKKQFASRGYVPTDIRMSRTQIDRMTTGTSGFFMLTQMEKHAQKDSPSWPETRFECVSVLDLPARK